MISRAFLWLFLSAGLSIWPISDCLAGAVAIDLSRLSQFNLVPHLQYLRDEERKYTFEDMEGDQSKLYDWRDMKKEMLRFGYLEGLLWLKADVYTVPDKSTAARQFFLDFHKVIDSIQVKACQDSLPVVVKNIVADGVERQFIPTNSNVFFINLEGGRKYSFIFKIDSKGSVGGEVRLWSYSAYEGNQIQDFYGTGLYLLSAIFVALYGFFAYFTTGFSPFKYHSLYVISMLGLQGGQYGYLERLLNINVVDFRAFIVYFFLSLSFISAARMIVSLVTMKDGNEWFFKASKVLIFLGFLGIPLYALFSYREVVSYTVCLIFLGFFTCLTYIFSYFKKNFAESVTILTALVVLSPSAFMQIFGRYGLIDSSFLTEYLLIMSIGVEMIAVSAILFYRVKKLSLGYLQVRYFHEDTQLPNLLSLKAAGDQLMERNDQYLYARAWLSGLEQMEVLMGENYCRQFFLQLVRKLQIAVAECPFIFKSELPNKQSTYLFIPERHTIGAFLSGDDQRLLDEYQSIIMRVMREVKQEYQYNMDTIAWVVGASSLPDKRIEQVLQDSQIAMLHSYKSKRNTQLYQDDMGKAERRQLMLINDFRSALTAGELYLLWQPQFHAKTKQLVGMEVLTRWRHPILGEVSPATFIPLLESSMQINLLTRWVIEQVFQVLDEIINYFPEIDVAINLSVQDLLTGSLIEFLDSNIALYPGVQQCLTLEVTESMMIQDGEALLETVVTLQERGIRFSIDDFGAGYTSLGHLELLPANELKIDKRFVDSCEQSNSRAIVSSIIDMAKKLNMTVIVEGIEYEHQADLFVALGVDRLQGWLYARPMPLPDVISRFVQACDCGATP